MKLSRVHFPVTALGPGKRIGVWFQGCSIRCPGCISVDTWTSEGPSVEVADVVALLEPWLPIADGVTISGGEPFDQLSALRALLQALRPWMRAEADILVYSGYPREALALPDEIDALVSDPFELDTPQTMVLRGSDNQRLHPLTARGRARYAGWDRARGPQDDCLDVMLDESGAVWMAGIPRRGDLQRLVGLMKVQGARAQTTEHRTR